MLAAVAAYYARAATAGKAGKVWSLPRFWFSIPSYKKQPVKKIWGRILDLAWLKFAVAAMFCVLKPAYGAAINVGPRPAQITWQDHCIFKDYGYCLELL